jgi:hypothetical protein
MVPAGAMTVLAHLRKTFEGTSSSTYEGGAEVEKLARRICAEAMRNLSKCSEARTAILTQDGVGVLQSLIKQMEW